MDTTGIEYDGPPERSCVGTSAYGFSQAHASAPWPRGPLARSVLRQIRPAGQGISNFQLHRPLDLFHGLNYAGQRRTASRAALSIRCFASHERG
jgi:hypothetical protein